MEATLDDDEREIELSALCATFPEIVRSSEDSFSASLDLSVTPNSPLRISFSEDPKTQAAVLHNLHYLPPLHVKFSLPPDYPKSKPPYLKLSTDPPWIPKATLVHLQKEGVRLWEEFGHDQMLFAFIDMLQDEAMNAFGAASAGGDLPVLHGDKIALLDFNIKAKKEAFDNETFECGICLDPKKGSVCHRMWDCEHVFCVQCLQDFYNNAITTGDLSTVICLAPGCAKDREAKSEKPRKAKTFITPGELLQIPLEQSVVERYVKLKHKAQLESDKNTVYCPRKWCQGAARSKKHRKPQGLEIVDDSDDESETETANKKTPSRADLMRICEDCSFAFCSRCFQGWHGEFVNCIPRNTSGELTEEDKASLEYVRLHSTPCPSCDCPAQKTHGCNHMICFKCATHFCYLCSSWLPPDNPYKHYNTPTQGCYMRLWELEMGDGDDVGIGFAGGHYVEEDEEEEEEEDEENQENEGDRQVVDMALAAEALRIQPLEQPQPVAQGAPAQGAQRAPGAARHVREGPLVLRLDLPAQPPPPPEDQARPPAPARLGGRQAVPNRRGRGGAVRGGNRGRGGPVPARPIQNDRDDVHAVEEAVLHRQWLERFMEMAMNDEEDDWDSGEDDVDDREWHIPPR